MPLLQKKKTFKRLEHLQRHERIRPCPLPRFFSIHRKNHFPVNAGAVFLGSKASFNSLGGIYSHIDRDLLSRHERLCHSTIEEQTPTSTNLAVHTQNANEITPDLYAGLGHGPDFNTPEPESHVDLLQSQGHIPGALSNDDDPYDHMGLGNVIPSHFLDTDISLCDLFQRFPSQHQPAAQGDFRSTTGLTEPAQHHDAHSLPSEQSDSQNPPLPPRFPSADEQLHNSNLDAGSDTAGGPWILSSAAYKRISERVVQNRSSLSEFRLPSKFTLVRYLEGYFRGFHDHLPFLHPPTFDPQNIELELVLALAAVGAYYRFEHAKGYQLYDAARCLTERSFRDRRRGIIGAMTVGSPAYTKITTASDSSFGASYSPLQGPQVDAPLSNPQDEGPNTCLQRAQTLIVLMAMSAWGEQPLVQDSLAIGSQLAVLVRELGISQPDDTTGLDLSWKSWAMHQQRRRTLLVAFILFNLQSIFFDVPPLILNQEVALCLPSCEADWKVKSPADWKSYRQTSCSREHAFTAALDRLLQGRSVSAHGAISAFSNYVSYTWARPESLFRTFCVAQK
ncbi:hypothetical protein N7490_002278 [Penicillium lividum]|nr:hypothetical protein N7490_002278 [Penicillium lividum]